MALPAEWVRLLSKVQRLLLPAASQKEQKRQNKKILAANKKVFHFFCDLLFQAAYFMFIGLEVLIYFEPNSVCFQYQLRNIAYICATTSR